MLDVNYDGAFLYLTQTCGSEQFTKVSPPGTGQPRLVLDVWIELVRCLPKETEWPPSASMVPNAGCHDSLRARHTRHLAEPSDGIGHEVDDKLRQCSIEQTLERQFLCCSALHPHRGIANANRLNKALRGIDGPNSVRPQASEQLGHQRPGTAAHVDHALSRRDAGELSKPGRQR